MLFCFLVQNSSSSTVTAALTVLRLKGRFSVATVDWMLIGRSNNLVLSPRNGTLTFLIGQPHQTVNINISGTHVCICSFISHVLPFCKFTRLSFYVNPSMAFVETLHSC